MAAALYDSVRFVPSQGSALCRLNTRNAGTMGVAAKALEKMAMVFSYRTHTSFACEKLANNQRFRGAQHRKTSSESTLLHIAARITCLQPPGLFRRAPRARLGRVGIGAAFRVPSASKKG